MDEQQINNIYINCNRAGVDMEELLRLCLDPKSGITVKGLKVAKYRKIDQLEAQYKIELENLTWINVSTKGTLQEVSDYIKNVNQGIFSEAHLAEAREKQKSLAAEIEDKEWADVSKTTNVDELLSFIDKIKEGIYSKNYLQDAIKNAETLEWNRAKGSKDINVLKEYIKKCEEGFYPTTHISEAKDLFEEWILEKISGDWNRAKAEPDLEARARKINEFIQKYTPDTDDTDTKISFSVTIQDYLDRANQELGRLADEREARIDWIDASERNTILAYIEFINKHPHSTYREEAEQRIKRMKENLLSDMKRYPFKYDRNEMYQYISSNALTMEDLVDTSNILTDRAYSHIKRYPRLQDEQRNLPVSTLTDPKSEEGRTDIYFFGVSGSGKTCVLSGLMSLTGQLGFKFDPKGPGGGGNYAIELRNYARSSMLPPATDQNYIQVIDAEIRDEKNNIHTISLIEMAGEKTAQFAAIDNPTGLADLGPGAAGLLSNNNEKVIFFVIDPTNRKDIQMGGDSHQWVMQSDVLNCVSSLIAKNKSLMKKVKAIHIILTKSDTLGDYVDNDVVKEVLSQQGYDVVLEDLKSICEKYDINIPTGFHVGIYPFCVGRFMPGDVYTFDPTDSLKILRVIQQNTEPIKNPSFLERIIKWFNG